MATHIFQLQVLSWNLCLTNFSEHYKFIHPEHVINHLHDMFTSLMSFTFHWFNLKCKWHISLYLTSPIISSTSEARSVYSIFAYPTYTVYLIDQNILTFWFLTLCIKRNSGKFYINCYLLAVKVVVYIIYIYNNYLLLLVLLQNIPSTPRMVTRLLQWLSSSKENLYISCALFFAWGQNFKIFWWIKYMVCIYTVYLIHQNVLQWGITA